jgi:hypothetical protein
MIVTRKIGSGLAAAAATIVAAVFIVWAKKAGLIDGDAGQRFVMAFIGLSVAAYGNATPKSAPYRSARAQSVRRVAGWLMVIGGLANAAIWTFAPYAVAPLVSMVPIIVAITGVVAYCWWSRPAAHG